MFKRVLAVVAAAGLLAGCGGSKPGSSDTGSSSAAKGAAPTVVVKNFSFSPGNLTVTRGTKVTWKFEDDVAHNVTSDDKKFGSKTVQSGSYSYTFGTAGKYSYFCSIHQYMKGTVTVQ